MSLKIKGKKIHERFNSLEKFKWFCNCWRWDLHISIEDLFNDVCKQKLSSYSTLLSVKRCCCWCIHTRRTCSLSTIINRRCIGVLPTFVTLHSDISDNLARNIKRIRVFVMHNCFVCLCLIYKVRHSIVCFEYLFVSTWKKKTEQILIFKYRFIIVVYRAIYFHFHFIFLICQSLFVNWDNTIV